MNVLVCCSSHKPITHMLDYGGYYFDPYDDEAVYSEYTSIDNYNVYSILKKNL